MNPEEPTLAAAVAYFVDIAKGKTASSYGQTGLGAVRQPTTYHVIPPVKLVTPTAQAVAQAKDILGEQKVIKGRKRNGPPSTGHKRPKVYQTPGLD